MTNVYTIEGVQLTQGYIDALAEEVHQIRMITNIQNLSRKEEFVENLHSAISKKINALEELTEASDEEDDIWFTLKTYCNLRVNIENSL